MLPSRWPKWTLIVVAVGLVVGSIALAFVLEPIGLALAPTITPDPTLPVIPYAAPMSTECTHCHTDREALAASAGASVDITPYYVDPATLNTPHSSLGCMTCHGGTGDTAVKETAHQGLVLDLSQTHPEDCLICHRDLPAQIPEDHLKTPHGEITNAVWEGSSCGVLCSDCHGAVGHGFDPVTGSTICPMSVCLDCHIERNLGDNLTQCSTCHVGPHDVSASLSCNDCHTATDNWQQTSLSVHPVALTGAHATADCFSCHNWPNFQGLDYVCSDCHERPHELGNDDCALCHTPDGWVQSADALVAAAAPFPHPAADHEDCRSCHGVADSGATPIPADHKGRTNDTCQVCHKAAPAPAILHPAEGHTDCLECHGEGKVAEFTVSLHGDFTNDDCSTCHASAGVVPLPILHTLDGRADCVMCHASNALHPYPSTHEGWGNDLCLLCHEASEKPTATEHTFPQDHNATDGNCVFCHPNDDFTTYHCETCHALPGMGQVHEARGIADIENKCVLCHPNGTKP